MLKGRREAAAPFLFFLPNLPKGIAHQPKVLGFEQN